MAYQLLAIFGKELTLRRLKGAAVHPLKQGFGLIPLPGVDDPVIEGWLRTVSSDDVVAYVEADYFGGAGDQSAVLWREGIRQRELASINEAAREMGAVREGNQDEFETLGFGKHRRTESWFAHAVLPPATGLAELLAALQFAHADEFVAEVVREHAAERLGELGSGAGPALPELERAAMEGGSYGVRIAACVALTKIGGEGVAALVRVITCSEGAAAEERWPAVHAAGKLGARGAEVIPALVFAANDKDSSVRSQVADSLAAIGIWSKPVEDVLEALAKDTEEYVRQAAAEAVAALKP